MAFRTHELLLLLLGIHMMSTISYGTAFKTHQYAGVKVLRLHPSNTDTAETLNSLLPSIGSGKIEVWHTRRRRSVDVSVPSTDLEELLELIKFLQIPHETLVDDLRDALEVYLADNVQPEVERQPFHILRYNTWDEIVDWLKEQANDHQHMMTLMEIGKSWHKRPIHLVKLTAPGDHHKKPALWMDAGIHSNEWVGPATLLFYINEILSKYDHDKSLQELLATYDLYILPVFNVDGYVYTWTEDRLWRKSRSERNNTDDCSGVDMNRNWPFKWGLKPGMSSDPCSIIFGGPEPVSEPEVRAVVRFLRKHRTTIAAYVAFHSYSQMWMMPYSYTNQKPRDFPELERISRQVTKAIHDTYGKNYTYGTVEELLGTASGSSVDYTYGKLGIKYSFGIELRDDGLFGSLLPPTQIAPTALESLEGIKTLVRLIKD